MTDDLEALRAAFEARETPDASGCPDAERLFAAARGGLSAAERREIVAHTAACAACAAGWRLARELPGSIEVRPRRVPAWAGAAAALLAAAAAGVIWLRAPDPPEYREPSSAAVASQTAATLPRDRFVLRWTATAPDARYAVWVTTDALAPVDAARGLERPEHTVPASALAALPAGDRAALARRGDAAGGRGRPLGDVHAYASSSAYPRRRQASQNAAPATVSGTSTAMTRHHSNGAGGSAKSWSPSTTTPAQAAAGTPAATARARAARSDSPRRVAAREAFVEVAHQALGLVVAQPPEPGHHRAGAGLEERAGQAQHALAADVGAGGGLARGQHHRTTLQLERRDLARLQQPVLVVRAGGQQDRRAVGESVVGDRVGREVEQRERAEVGALQRGLAGPFARQQTAVAADRAARARALPSRVRERAQRKALREHAAAHGVGRQRRRARARGTRRPARPGRPAGPAGPSTAPTARPTARSRSRGAPRVARRPAPRARPRTAGRAARRRAPRPRAGRPGPIASPTI